jgi:hypothetical protein
LQRGTPTGVAPTSAAMMEMQRAPATVEIETMTKGLPKVVVRVDGDDADSAAEAAFATYIATVARLAEWDRTREE